MEQTFKDFFNYNHDCNQKLVAVFEKEESRISARSVQVFNHILDAHAVWISRIQKTQSSIRPWDLHPVSTLREMDRNNFLASISVLQSHDLAETVSYVNTLGDSYTNSVRDILFHIINHSTYHRGQIAADFRQTGLEPIATDYIFFKR